MNEIARKIQHKCKEPIVCDKTFSLFFLMVKPEIDNIIYHSISNVIFGQIILPIEIQFREELLKDE